tara:strand:- start:8169 stop:9665 length:1497 start_codon:yes stop_codon:yes gene_type:complete
MNFVTTKTAADTINTECLILGVFREKMIGETAKYIDKISKKSISKLITSGDIKTGLGSTKIINNLESVKAKRVLIVGLGNRDSFEADEYKKACESAMKSISGIKLNNFANYLIVEKVKDLNNYYKSRYFIEAYFSSIYQFNQLKTGKKNKISTPTKIIMGASNSGDSAKIKLGCEHGKSISVGVNIAKDLGNLPANICTPTYLANESKKLAKKYKKMSVKILNEGALKKLKMDSFLSVTAGSKEPAKMIVMEYKGAKKQRPHVLVGKGVTFDTGGISIKPSAKMDEMKYDMCGAATVIGVICAVAEMKLPINLNVVVPACENRPSSSATLPGDIVKSMSGQTIEILNTDAEGRLILCDALTYSERFNPKYIVDVATLTGACVVALGHIRTAIMSNNEELSNKLIDAADKASDKAWKMPMGNEYDIQLKSNFADMANIGSGYGGSITAACFLGRFTKNMKWAHLDIAGTAWKSGAQKGSTGRPVPMLSEFILNQSKKNS